MIEQRIAQLALALRALSGIHTAENEYYKVSKLLDETIEEAKEQNRPTQKQPDDKIPF